MILALGDVMGGRASWYTFSIIPFTIACCKYQANLFHITTKTSLKGFKCKLVWAMGPHLYIKMENKLKQTSLEWDYIPNSWFKIKIE